MPACDYAHAFACDRLRHGVGRGAFLKQAAGGARAAPDFGCTLRPCASPGRDACECNWPGVCGITATRAAHGYHEPGRGARPRPRPHLCHARRCRCCSPQRVPSPACVGARATASLPPPRNPDAHGARPPARAPPHRSNPRALAFWEGDMLRFDAQQADVVFTTATCFRCVRGSFGVRESRRHARVRACGCGCECVRR